MEIQIVQNLEILWLTQDQIALLFGKNRTVITKHIGNIFKGGDLDAKATNAKFAHVQKEANHDVARDILY